MIPTSTSRHQHGKVKRYTGNFFLTNDGLYIYSSCSDNVSGKHIPKLFMNGEPSVKRSPGRPEDKTVQVAFQKVACYLEENVDVLIRLQDFVKVMSNSCVEKAYSGKHL
jgi:hypothetical protein